jgi:uncharacterized membrane protein
MPLTQFKPLKYKTEILVLSFFLLGLALRLTHLSLKPIWMDEAATLVFSLGHSTYDLPIDRLTTLQESLLPLTPDSNTTVWDTIHYLFREDNHPPLYFALAHYWMKLFPLHYAADIVTPGRMLPAILGSLAIPLVFIANRIAFGSTLAGHIGAAFMAVSPLGVYLSQEARHYGSGITFVTASLLCFIAVVHHLKAETSPPIRLCILWVMVNGLGFANHYFTILILIAEGLVLVTLAGEEWQRGHSHRLWHPSWRRVYGVGLGSLVGILVWFPMIAKFYGSPQTGYLLIQLNSIQAWLNPIAQTLLSGIVMIITPITSWFTPSPLKWPIIVIVGILNILFLIFLIPALIQGTKNLLNSSHLISPKAPLGGMILLRLLGAILILFAVIIYGTQRDISRGLRYTFCYYPLIIMLLGGIFSSHWLNQDSGIISVTSSLSWKNWKYPKKWFSGKRLVILTGMFSLLGSIFVINNLALTKFYLADRFVSFVDQQSPNPIVLVMGVSRENQPQYPTAVGIYPLSVALAAQQHWLEDIKAHQLHHVPQVLYLNQTDHWSSTLHTELAHTPKSSKYPIDLWVLDFPKLSDNQLSENRCKPDANTPLGNKGNYTYHHYVCL